MKDSPEEKKFPSGAYYIGDLCYVMSETNWEEFLEQIDYESGVFDFHGHQIGIFFIPSDGCYGATSGKKYSVDSGTIGICSFDFINSFECLEQKHKEELENYGSIEFFTDEIEIGRRGRDRIYFGEIEIYLSEWVD